MSKTNNLANYFGSKIVPPGSNQNSEKKAPIWQFYVQSDKEKNKAVCKLCGGAFSLGSEKPKLQTTTGLKLHLKSKHQNEFCKFNEILEDVKSNKEKRKRETDCEVIPTSVQNKRQKTDLFQQTLPKYVESVKIWDVKSAKAQEFHRDVFECL